MKDDFTPEFRKPKCQKIIIQCILSPQLVGIYSNTRDYISGEPRLSLESTQVEWVDRKEALFRVKPEAVYKRLKDMLEFCGEITYRAYLVDPNRLDLNYQELEDRKI